MAVVSAATKTDLVSVAARAMRQARIDRELAEARYRDARAELARADGRVRETEFAYERACRG